MNSDLRREWNSMCRRLVERIATRSSDLTRDPVTITSDFFTDEERFEREKLFLRDTPLFVGLSREVQEEGDTLLFEDAGPSVIIVRTAGGALKAFLNVCPHRGGKLLKESCSRDSFVCPYHAWRFDLEGKLTARPRDEAFSDDEVGKRLTRVPVGEWAGMIFVRCEPGDESLDVEGFLGPIASLMKSLDLHVARLIESEVVESEANWKLVLDTNCEAYHVPSTHPTTINRWTMPYIYIQDSYGAHHRFSGPSRDMAEWVDLDEAEWPDSGYRGVHYIFPNTILTVTGYPESSLVVQHFYPSEEVGRSRAVTKTYAGFGQDGEEFLKRAHAGHQFMMHVLTTEDFPMAEDLWKNFRSLSQPTTIQEGRNEHILQDYHRRIAAAVGMPIGSD
ncbi:MAG TPA: aromatic ring-hydroxylating dioxygenase subunit alpha [Planctomycetaceae bacterium]|nr:aromatic ring-hydroxylating dioxygenase subunit alpha [Planctomycetaceae bacterium]